MTGLAAERWLVISASSPSSARAFAEKAGIDPTLVLDGPELVQHWTRLRRMVRDRGINAALLHSTAWRREVYPQVFQAALATVPVRQRYLADEESADLRPVAWGEAAGWLARIPVDAATALGLLGLGAGRLVAGPRQRPVARSSRQGSDAEAVLAVWRGPTGSSTGGAITHLSGILGAFRRAGYRVGLVTVVPPPPQLDAVVDDVEVVPPRPAAARVSHDISDIDLDQPIRRAGLRLADRLRPAFVYQRHATFLTAGTAIARARRLPLVLEWNCSEVWAQANWQKRLPFERLFTPLAAWAERRVVGAADVVAAVSEPAAEMARQAGATDERVVVVPNGVDPEQVRPSAATARAAPADGPVLGWVGSFGPWHGAEVLINALSLLPPDVRLVMIGDGVERPACMALARTLGVGHRVTWLGSVPHDVALARLAACDVLVSPHVPLPGTPFFGSPTKLFEYMALGRPIVASELEQLGAVLEHGRTARLVPPGEPAELSKGISEVLGLPDRGGRLGRQARQEAIARHTWAHRATAILDRLER